MVRLDGSRVQVPDIDRPLTGLLVDWAAGNEAAAHELLPLVYDELRRLARYHMARESPGHILQTSALVNEAYLRINGAGHRVQWQDRGHFFAVACRIMRRVLVDIARAQRNEKRGGHVLHVTFSDGFAVAANQSDRLVALHDALEGLSAADPRKAQVVEMRFFGGMNVAEIASVLRVSPETVKRDWKFSKAWLGRQLRPSHGPL